MYTFRALCTYIKEKELVYNVTLACFLPIRPVAWTNGYALLMIRYLIFYRLSRITCTIFYTLLLLPHFSLARQCAPRAMIITGDSFILTASSLATTLLGWWLLQPLGEANTEGSREASQGEELTQKKANGFCYYYFYHSLIFRVADYTW